MSDDIIPYTPGTGKAGKTKNSYYPRWFRLVYRPEKIAGVAAVHPDYSNQGIGSELLKFAEELAKEQGAESLRLDVFSDNLPAIHLYEKSKFEYIDTVDLGLEEYGLKWFKLYEKVIN